MFSSQVQIECPVCRARMLVERRRGAASLSCLYGHRFVHSFRNGSEHHFPLRGLAVVLVLAAVLLLAWFMRDWMGRIHLPQVT